MIAKEEVGKKASAEMEVVQLEVAEVLGEHDMDLTQLWM